MSTQSVSHLLCSQAPKHRSFRSIVCCRNKLTRRQRGRRVWSRWTGRPEWTRRSLARSVGWTQPPRDVRVYSSAALPRLLMVLLPLLMLLLLRRWEDKSFVTTESHPASVLLRRVVQFQSLSRTVDSVWAPNKNELLLIKPLIRLRTIAENVLVLWYQVIFHCFAVQRVLKH